MTRTMISAPKNARRGEIIEIKAMTAHIMETGHRVDAKGAVIPRNIISRFVCTYAGREVFSAELFPAIAANPFLSFSLVATESGPISFAWIDDRGATETTSVEIAVT